MSELFILHRASAQEEVKDPSLLAWTTCRRQIFFSWSDQTLEFDDQVRPGDEQLLGIEAEQRLVEILCGLHSPVIGETEVFGQFREWFENRRFSPEGRRLQPRVEQWFSLVKKLRERHLQGSGSNSYGSLLRQLLGRKTEVTVIGGGHLVRQSLPWLKSLATTLVVRDPQKAQELRELHPQLQIQQLTDPTPVPRTVILAAPLDKDVLESWLVQHPTEWLIDLRRDGKRDASWNFHFTSLDDLSLVLEDQRGALESIKKTMLYEIAQWSEKERAKAQIRPFGWEDLCL